MKRVAVIKLLAGLVGLSVVAAATGAISWFVPTANIEISDTPIEGETNGAYFAYGNGSQAQPYGISKPRHLYNLAWLTYLGYLGDKQYYYELAVDVSMEGWTIPPIGTTEHPFCGNFDGNGHVLSDCTISNTFAEYAKHPGSVTATNFNASQVKIVGIFGVVGNLDSKYAGTTAYSSTINAVHDLGILSATIKSSASDTLIGIAAGYVDAEMSNVAVNGSSIYTLQGATAYTYGNSQHFTTNVSDYSLVGYATTSCLGKLKLRSDDADIPTLSNPNTVSGGDNWGGSINMQDMYTYLRARANASAAYTFVTAETVYRHPDGTETTEVTSEATNSNYSSNWSEYYRYEGSKIIEDDKEYASFTFARSSANNNFSSYNANDTKYVCLYGGVTGKRGTTASGGSVTNASKTITTKTETGTFRISNGTSNYLSYRGNISNQTNTSTASNWSWENKYLKTTYNNRTYYLNISNGSLAGNTTKSTQWTYSETDKNLYATVGNTTYYVKLNNTTWQLVTSLPTETYYTIHDDTKNGYVNNGDSYYLSNIGSSVVTKWGYGLKGQSYGYGYYDQSNTGQYLGWYNDSTYSAQCYSDSKYHYHLESGSATGTGKLVAVNGNTKYYMYYNSSSSPYFMGTTTEASGDTFTITYVESHSLNISLNAVTTDSTQTVNATYDTYPTYFPLTREKDEEGEYTGSGKPDVKNTGYLVSGANLTDSTQGPYGDIRVSRFDIGDIYYSLSASSKNNVSGYTSSKLEVVTRTCVRGDDGTYTDSNWTRIEDKDNKNNTISNTLSSTFKTKKNYKTELRLSKYENSRSQLSGTLSTGNNYIYGLHFMDAEISKDRVVTAPNVIIMDGKTLDKDDRPTGTPYTNYPLPQDSIDFNLKDQGFINFFAGTYFTNNNTFFSLHTITRNASNAITQIREIKQIYAPASGAPSDDNPYVYSYDASGTKPSGAGDLVFDTSWITNPNMVTNAVYYFEIPVNSGEYALGSVSSKNGAYLMYLDIGAGIGNYKDITTTEHIEITVKDADYPLGVDFTAIVTGTGWTSVEGGESAAVTITAPANANQTLTYSYASTVLTVSTASGSPPIVTEYQAYGATVQKSVGSSSSALGFSPPVLYTMIIDRVTYENFNVFTSSVTRTVTETLAITGGESGLKIQLAKPVVSSGFTITSAINFAVISGPASVIQSDGLLTRTGTGVVEATMTYAETMSNVTQWATAQSATTDETEGTIFAFHVYDYEDPNLVIRYVYDGPNRTYTLYVTATKSTIIDIDSVPELTGYTIIVVVNGDTTNQITLTSASTTTSIPITVQSGS